MGPESVRRFTVIVFLCVLKHPTTLIEDEPRIVGTTVKCYDNNGPLATSLLSLFKMSIGFVHGKMSRDSQLKMLTYLKEFFTDESSSSQKPRPYHLIRYVAEAFHQLGERQTMPRDHIDLQR